MIDLKHFDDWEDWDVSLYFLAVELGLASYKEEDPFYHFRENKGVYVTYHSFQASLQNILDEFVRIGLLEHDEESLKYRRRHTELILSNQKEVTNDHP